MEKHAMKELDAFYTITQTAIMVCNGAGLLSRYNGSLAAALTATFPEHMWKRWKFRNLDKGRNYF